MFKKKIIAINLSIIIFSFFVFVCTYKISANDEEETYTPTYTVFKMDDMENLDIPTDSPLATADYVWNNSNLLWAETNNLSTITDSNYVLNGEKSIKWMPGAGDSSGWTAPNVGIGIAPNKMQGSNGGYLFKLELLLKLENTENLVIKAYDSNNVLRQECIINKNHENGSDEATKDKDFETVVAIEKLTKAEMEYCKVSFTFRSSIHFTTYFTFVAQASNADCSIYMDDITLYKDELPDVSYRNYEMFVESRFEEDSLDTSMFNGNKVNVKDAVLNTENVIEGSQDLKITAQTRNQVSTINSSNIELEKNFYKLYFKFKSAYTSSVGIVVHDSATNDVIYDFIVNPISSERITSTVNVLTDCSKFSINGDQVWTCYGEFEIKKTTNIYLTINMTVSNVNGYSQIDEVTLLKSYKNDPAPTEYDNDPEKVEGIIEATYKKIDESSYLMTSIRSMIRNNSTFDNTLLIISVIFVLFTVTSIVVLKDKKQIKNRIKILILFLLVSFTFSNVGCSNGGTENTAPKGYNIVNPQKITGKLDNPGMGWVLLEEPTYGGHVDTGASGTFPEVDNVSLSTSWKHIEIDEGVYDFTLCDKTVDYWVAKGKRINLRICTDSLVLPYTYNGCPDYLFEKYNVGYQVVDYLDPGPIRTCRTTDIRDKNYLYFLDKFLNELYNHYKDNDMVDVVEIRGFGLWGEWHHGMTFESKADRISSLDNILSYYYDVFKDSNKLLCVCASWDPDYTTTNEYYTAAQDDELQAYLNYVNWSSFDTAWRMPGVSFRRDSGAALLRYDLDERILAEAFRSGKKVPLFGEYSTNYYNLSNNLNGFNLMSGIDDILYKMRPNYCTVLGWVAVDLASSIEQNTNDYIDRANTKLGYRLAVDEAYVPQSISTDKPFEVMTSWSNSAVGIFPYKTSLRYHLLDSNDNIVCTMEDNQFDARGFKQGEINDFYSSLQLPSSVENGTYKLGVSIQYQDELIALGMAGETKANSRIYALSEVKVVNSTNNKHIYDDLITYDKINDYKFEKNSTYIITFNYMPGFKMENFYFGNNDCYEFSLVSRKDQTKKVGTYRWQDISETVGQKTIVVNTDDDDYQMKVRSINFDTIDIDKVWIRKVKSYSTNFDNYDPTDPKTLLEPINITTATPETDGIDGTSLGLCSKNTNEQHILSKVDTNNVEFKKGVSYTVSFDFRAGGNVGNGGYYFIALGDYENIKNDFSIIGEWYERDDNYDTKKTFTFTPTEDNQTLAFGINNAGSYLIDNFSIVEKSDAKEIKGTNIDFERNEIPTWNVGLGTVETFETGSFQSSGFEWGQFAWGRMTLRESEVVNYSEDNKTSILCRIEEEAYNPEVDNVWFEFIRSKLKYYAFERNEYYKVSFDYKILKKFKDGNVFCFFRDDTLPNRFQEAINAPYLLTDTECDLTSGKKVGEVYTFSKAFKMKDYDNFQFMMCSHGLWEMTVDNILIEKITEEEAKSLNTGLSE